MYYFATNLCILDKEITPIFCKIFATNIFYYNQYIFIIFLLLISIIFIIDKQLPTKKPTNHIYNIAL